MTIDEYVTHLESKVNNFDAQFVTEVKDWSPNDKLYVFLHKIQLYHMNNFYSELNHTHQQLKWIRAQTS